METQRIINEEFERLKMEIENMNLKSQLSFARHKQLKESGDEKYNPFGHGVAYGYYRAITAIKCLIGQTQKKINRQIGQ